MRFVDRAPLSALLFDHDGAYFDQAIWNDTANERTVRGNRSRYFEGDFLSTTGCINGSIKGDLGTLDETCVENTLCLAGRVSLLAAWLDGGSHTFVSGRTEGLLEEYSVSGLHGTENDQH